MSETAPESSPRSGRSKKAAALSLCLGLGFLGLFLKGLDFDAVAGQLLGADPRFALLGITLQFAFYISKGHRWGAILPPPLPSLLARVKGVALGISGNIVFPGRAGEGVRVLYLARSTPHGLGSSLASLVLERIFDLAAIGGMLAAATWTLTSQDPMLSKLRSVGMVAGVGMAFVPWILGAIFSRAATRQALSRFLLGWTPTWLREKLETLLANLTLGLGQVSSLTRLAWILWLSFAHWALSVATIMASGMALDLKLGLAGGCLIQGALAFAVALPQAPGFLGPFQVAASTSLVLLGFSESQGGAFAIMHWIVVTIPALLAGLLALLADTGWFGEAWGLDPSARLDAPSSTAPSEPVPSQDTKET